MPLSKQEWLALEKKAYELRKLTLQTTMWAGSGHIGGGLSILDLLTVLYHKYLNIKVDDPQWEIPDEWTRETPALLIDELGKCLDIRLDEKAIIGLSLGGVDCSAWFFVDGREKEKPAGQREYYLGYLYDHYNNPLIFIYRGHHLYGME